MGFMDSWKAGFARGREDAEKEKAQKRAAKPAIFPAKPSRTAERIGKAYEKARPAGRAARVLGKGAYVVGKEVYDVAERVTRPRPERKANGAGKKNGKLVEGQSRREFDGRRYKLMRFYSTKTAAQKDAKALRADEDREYLVRVTQEGYKWALWVR